MNPHIVLLDTTVSCSRKTGAERAHEPGLSGSVRTEFAKI